MDIKDQELMTAKELSVNSISQLKEIKEIRDNLSRKRIQLQNIVIEIFELEGVLTSKVNKLMEAQEKILNIDLRNKKGE